MIVLGFIVQCDRCPQKAIVDTQPAADWVCPRCAEVAEPVPYTGPESGYDMGGRSCAEAAAMFPQHTKPRRYDGLAADEDAGPTLIPHGLFQQPPAATVDDDEEMLRKIQG